MAKPAKKRSQAEEQPKKRGGKPVAKAVKAKGEGKAAAAKAKPKGNGKAAGAKAKAKKQAEPQGLKARLSRSAPAVKGKPAKGAAKEKRGTGKFLREVKVELTKVTWPSRDELIQATIVVLVAVAIAGVYIFVFDEIFSRLIQYLTNLTA